MTGAPPSEEDFSKMPINDRLASRNPDLLKSMVLDANAVAQEKATECLKAFVEFGGKAAGKAFGPKQVSPKPILKVLPTIFAHSDKTVRAEGSLLAQELHRYIGAALEPTIDTLKDIQAKELRSQFEELDKKGEGKPIPERYILSEKIKAEEAAAAAAAAASGGDPAQGGGGDEAAEEEGDVDAFDLADPIDPFKSKDFPANLDEALASKKWKDRTDALEALLKALNSSPKLLMNNGYDSVIDQLTTKIAKDSNINVVLECCRCIESMAKGLRSNFSKYKEKVLPPILEKLKEKKASTVEILAQTLDSVFQTVSFSDVLEDIFAATKHKNPNVKTEAIKFLVRCLRTTRTPPSKADIKPIGDTLVNALSDANADVRDAGIQVATVKAKMGGPTPSAASSSSAPAAKKPTLSSSAKPKAAAPSASAPRKPLLGDKENESPAPKAAPAPVAKPLARLMVSFVSEGRSQETSSDCFIFHSQETSCCECFLVETCWKAAAAATEPVKYRFSSEDAEAKAAELIPSNISTQIASGVWKDRLNGMTELLTWLQGEVESIESEVVLRSLAKKPVRRHQTQRSSWRNSQHLRREDLLRFRFGSSFESSSFSQGSESYRRFSSLGRSISSGLWNYWCRHERTHRSSHHLSQVGNAGVRTNATKVIGTISRFIGPAINTFLGDLNSQLKTSVEAEIDKASSQSRPEPTKFGAEHKVSSGGGSKGGNGGGASASAAEEDDLDALIPRVDLDKLVTPSIITRLGDANWKERKEALEELQGSWKPIRDSNPT
ncbi:hypothetical protein L7F22_046161 [Adiantum nelumboides]|nr:hypothetical protein [Adiantum nelumboides]